MKKIILSFILALCGLFSVNAQISTWTQSAKDGKSDYFTHLRVGANIGTTGLGLEVGTQVTDILALRIGIDFVPHFEYDMDFQIQVGDTPESKYDEHGQRIETKFDRMAEYLRQITGIQVDDQVRMVGEPSFTSFKLIADVYPFKNKRWYFSAGFYLSSPTIAHAYNTTHDMSSLLAVSIYNNIYTKVKNEEDIIEGLELPPEIRDKILSYGKMGMHVGDYKVNGEKYMMVPDDESMVKAYMKVNSFKPYIGAGYTVDISQNGRFRFAVNAGVLFWGGTPKVYTHDGTEIVGDLTNIWGQIGHYVNIVKPLIVYPTINASITYRIF